MSANATTRDPVCAMTVDPETAKHRHTHDGAEYLFCNPRCKERFIADPDAYITAKDPVCGMTVKRATAKHVHKHEGTRFYFCAARCLEKFQQSPDTYLAKAEGSAKPVASKAASGAPKPEDASVEYTCPMHPEIVQIGPGDCPKCGMALEPKTISAEEDPAAKKELADMQRRLAVCTVLTLPLFVIAMGGMLPGIGEAIRGAIGEARLPFVELALATPVVAWGAYPFFVRGIDSLRQRSPNMFTLIALGTTAAFGFSLVATFAPALLGHASEHLYYEAAAVITTLVLVGQVLELRARSRTGNAIRALLRLAPKTARRIGDDGKEEDVPLESIVVGDRLRVRPGERIPLDGVVVTGSSAVDESMITGEPIPAEKAEKDGLTGGTLNGDGALVMEVTRIGADTTLSKIVAMVGEAARSRAKLQRMVDRVSAWFVPAVVAISLAASATWGAIGPEPRLVHAIVSAVSVLIIACPCALGLATPMSIMAATGRGAQAGVLLKDADALETLSRVQILVVDKTGTLTEGKPVVRAVEIASGPDAPDEREVLRLLALAEASSEHPLAKAIVLHAKKEGVAEGAAAEVTTKAVRGKGIVAKIGERTVLFGTKQLLADANVAIGEAAEASAEEHRRQGATVSFIAIDDSYAGLVSIRDEVKASAKETLKALREELGLRVVMLTGDAETSARAIGKELGFAEGDVIANVLPDEKAKALRRIRASRKNTPVIAMAGDGINDAPALATADVGIAMGTGSDVAIESAGVTLMKGDLRGLSRAVRLGRAAMKNVRQNLWLAFGYNALAIPVAAGVLYPLLGLLLSPMLAAAAMSLSSVSVITNALRLRATNLD